MGFKERLKEARLLNHMTQEQVAEKIGVAKSTFTGYEKGNSEPNMLTVSRIMNTLKVDANFLWQDDSDFPMQVSYEELQRIEKYRRLDTRGKSHVDSVLQWETDRMEELQAVPAAVFEFHRPDGNDGRLLKYFRSASAGTGVFILGNEVTEQITVPDTPESRQADFAIKVSGDSMIPDYEDGDIVMVSQKAEMNHGDVGIFIVNNNVYIKEYGETELISRNPVSENIQISEYDNIVCMGKVIGKVN